MAIKHRLQQSIYYILSHNRDGSYETQAARKLALFKAAEDLCAGGYKLHHARGLKQKHVRYLNECWQKRGLQAATIKNLNSHLRWICQKLNKTNVVPSNDDLGVARRQYANNQRSAIDLKDVDLNKITSRHVLVHIHLQRYLGLRREEAIKLKPHVAEKGDYLVLQPSWCKGGRGRIVPILSPEARYWLEESKKLVNVPDQSLIPEGKSYIEHRNFYDREVRQAGIKNPHGLRHAYAQERYEQLTGWKCPKQGGPTKKMLTPEQRKQDRLARQIISEDLGHSRLQISVNYCGR